MEWIDEGIVLSARKHGESSAIVCALTREHGRHSGLVRGGSASKARGVLQAGNRLQLTWRARLSDHLGAFSCELLDGFAGPVLDDGDRLAALASACALSEAAVPEREVHEPLYDGLHALMQTLQDPDWAAAYVSWEIGLLGVLGFGLDFSACASTGGVEHLTYVSPKSGRAVSTEAAAPYKDKLLTLPAFLVDQSPASPADVIDGLVLSGYFLQRHAFSDGGFPAARVRLFNRLAERAECAT